jgi:hypothetical protein
MAAIGDAGAMETLAGGAILAVVMWMSPDPGNTRAKQGILHKMDGAENRVAWGENFFGVVARG